jgi:putative transposase
MGHIIFIHVHILLSIPRKYVISHVVEFTMGKSAIHLACVYGEIRQSLVGQSFWARGLIVSTVGQDEAVVHVYIRNQAKND